MYSGFFHVELALTFAEKSTPFTYATILVRPDLIVSFLGLAD